MTTAADLAERIDDRSAKGIAGALGRLVSAGTLAPGTRLPTVRALARALGVSPTTVNEAWQALGRAGVVDGRGRNGTFVRGVPPPGGPRRYARLAPAGPLRLDLSTGTPDPALLPDLGPVLAAVAGRTPPAGYLDDPVLPVLDQRLRERWPVVPGALTVVDGALDALDRLIAELVRYGDVVLVEEAAFPPVLDLIELAGAEAVPLACDDAGPRPEALAAALTRRPALAVLQPRAHNPLGISTSRDRSAALAAVLDGDDLLVVEDDHAGDIACSPLHSLAVHRPAQTVLVQSFSKSHGPDLRLAAVGGPAPLVEAIAQRRLLGPGWSSRLLQGVLAELLCDPATEARLARARATYAARRSALVEALRQRDVATRGEDGINLWVSVADEQRALVELAASGVGVAAGSPFVPGPGPAGHVRITCGLVDGDADRLADLVAGASRDGGRRRAGW